MTQVKQTEGRCFFLSMVWAEPKVNPSYGDVTLALLGREESLGLVKHGLEELLHLGLQVISQRLELGLHLVDQRHELGLQFISHGTHLLLDVTDKGFHLFLDLLSMLLDLVGQRRDLSLALLQVTPMGKETHLERRFPTAVSSGRKLALKLWY